MTFIFRWLREFIDEPNYGHVGLLKLLKQLQDSNNNLVYADKTNSKSKKNETVLTKEPVSMTYFIRLFWHCFH